MLLGQNHVGIYLVGTLIGCSAGTAISILLLVLTVRATKTPGTRSANILFAVCSLMWNLGGLAHALAITGGAPDQGRKSLALLAVQYSAAAAWPFAVFALWSSLVSHRWQRIGLRLLQTVSILSGAVIAAPLWYGVWAGIEYKTLLNLKESTAYNGAILLILGFALFRERLVSRSMRIPSLAILVGVFGASSAIVIQQLIPQDLVVCDILHVFSEQITLFIVLGAFFLFTRFRFSDLFIRYSLRVILASFTAIAFLLLNDTLSFIGLDSLVKYPAAARIFIEVLAAVLLLLTFAFAYRHLGECVDRWIFRAPDYRALLREVSETLVQLRDDSTIAETVEAAARHALDLKAVRLVALDILTTLHLPDAIREGELAEVDCHNFSLSSDEFAEVELLLPVRTEGQVSHVMAIAPGYARRGLVTHEVDFLRNVAALYGHRRDVVRNEQRSIAAQSREAVLQQQVTEAELRALRAQINPHFLFNSLNSIANLVVTNPEKAETMTLRLARVFRHVLANSSRPLIALHEEIEFLQTYLQIEEARFGDRLHVEIAVDPIVAMEPIPSLILQPIVENALKHGLAPKPGPGRLWITADTEENHVRLCVEDDGVGIPRPFPTQGIGNGQPKGVGLDNVALRLNALYHHHSRMSIEMRTAGGTRVTILLPRENGVRA